MSGLFILLVIFLAVVRMVLAMFKFNQHPFIVFTVIAIAVGLVCKIPTKEVINTVKNGLNNILTSIGIVVLIRTVAGTTLEKIGAVLTVANTILKLVGKKNSVLTMAITGYVTGTPIFYDSGFIILSPISRALVSRGNVSLAVMATTLSGGLYVTHRLVPSTSGPIATVDTLEADLGLTILVGPPISVSATLSALFYAKKVSGRIDIPVNPEYMADELLQKYGELPDALHSFSPTLPPVVLIALRSVGDFPSASFGGGVVKMLLSFIDSPVTALILGVFLVMTLIPAVGKKNTLSWTIEGVINSAGILVITGASGALGAILQKLPIASTLSVSLLGFGVGVFLPFTIATLLKTVMGAPTVAVITISAMITPLVPALGLTTPLVKVFVIMAIGAGSITISHTNDSYFQVVSQFSDVGTRDVYKRRTGMTGVIGTVTITIMLILSLAFCGVHSQCPQNKHYFPGSGRSYLPRCDLSSASPVPEVIARRFSASSRPSKAPYNKLDKGPAGADSTVRNPQQQNTGP